MTVNLCQRIRTARRCVPSFQSSPRIFRHTPQVCLVLAAFLLVHSQAVPTLAAGRTVAVTTNATLPKPATEMRDAILSAIQSGRLAELKLALELNEMPPDLADERGPDPIAFLKTVSRDGEGREILAILKATLALPPATVPLGRDIENNAIYVWPYLAERDLSRLTPNEHADLATLMTSEEIETLKVAKRWTWWRLAIGADGTWHSFRKEK
jgi:hypothetical protein